MAEISCNLSLYKTPTNEILRHRKEFYGVMARNDEKTTKWLHRIQSQIDRCEFPPMISREYLLIDKFVCELNDDERKFIRSVNIWTLSELNECFFNQTESIGNWEVLGATVDKTNEQQQMPSSLPLTSVVPIKCEVVSN